MKRKTVIEIDDFPEAAQKELKLHAPDYRWNNIYKITPCPFENVTHTYSSLDDDFDVNKIDDKIYIRVEWEDGEVLYFDREKYPVDVWLQENGFTYENEDEWHIDLEP
jgi:hypothetical protein